MKPAGLVVVEDFEMFGRHLAARGLERLRGKSHQGNGLFPVPKDPSFSDSAPSCVQCRSPMFVALCEPDFKNPALMLATYECSVCGLRDRAQIGAARTSAKPVNQQSAPLPRTDRQ